MLIPKQVKYKKYQKGRISYNFNYSQNFKFAPYALVATSSARIRSSHIYAAQLAIKRKILRDGKLYTRIFPHIPVTKKPLEVRMGKGKGAISYWMTRVKPGTFLFELNCSNPELAKIAFKVASSKLPVKTIFIKK